MLINYYLFVAIVNNVKNIKENQISEKLHLESELFNIAQLIIHKIIDKNKYIEELKQISYLELFLYFALSPENFNYERFNTNWLNWIPKEKVKELFSNKDTRKILGEKLIEDMKENKNVISNTDLLLKFFIN